MRWSTASVLRAAAAVSAAQYDLSISSTDPYSLTISQGNRTVVKSIGILTGTVNYTEAVHISASEAGNISASSGGGQITHEFVSDTVAKIQIDAGSNAYAGAVFDSGDADALSYGVWEYPWGGSVANANVSFEIKGIGEAPGINWSNARAPFFFTNAGYGVYIDTLAMGLFNFSTPGSTRFVFNTTSLTVYVILPTAPHDYKSILSQHIALSAPISLPPDSAYGPILFSDDWNTDFHNTVSTAAQNYLDVASHLHTHRIRATALFADRPYGTGNGSWGNFDFNATAYPDPAALIATLASRGLDFQVWVANRAPPATLLSNASTTAHRNWLFDVDPAAIQGGLAGPALNLSIPTAYAFFEEHLRAFTDAGVRGYKIDRGEEGEMPAWEQNVQSTLFLALCHGSMAAAYGEGAFFNFARNVVDRGRRHAALWNGDAHADFTGLAYSVASGIRAGLLGFAMWGSDTGGYVRGPGEPGEELWARWMHVAAWSPMYEIMVGTGATPWYAPYNRSAAGLVGVFRDTAAAHHGLLPYIRSCVYAAAGVSGLPVMRALFLEEPADARAWAPPAVDDEYFFGDGFLVAPIVEAGGVRSVYFPGDEGAAYLEYGNKTDVYRGGETANFTLGVHKVPVFVRAGAIVPRGDVFRANDRWTVDWAPYLDVEVFPSWGVPRSEFAYFNKEKGEVVDIALTTDEGKREVKVKYGEVGFNGSIVVYTKDGVEKVDLVAEGGEAVVEGVRLLFEV